MGLKKRKEISNNIKIILYFQIKGKRIKPAKSEFYDTIHIEKSRCCHRQETMDDGT